MCTQGGLRRCTAMDLRVGATLTVCLHCVCCVLPDYLTHPPTAFQLFPEPEDEEEEEEEEEDGAEDEDMGDGEGSTAAG